MIHRGQWRSVSPRPGESMICTSIVVAAELRFGAEKSGSSTLADRIDLLLSALEILPLETPADRHYGAVRQQLARQGTSIGPNDLLIRRAGARTGSHGRDGECTGVFPRTWSRGRELAIRMTSRACAILPTIHRCTSATRAYPIDIAERCYQSR